MTHQFCRTFDIFVYFFLVPLKNFSLTWRRHHFRWRATKFDLYSTFIAIEKWGFFNVPHLWHRATLYNGHLWGSLILTPFAERLEVLEVELSLPLFTTKIYRSRDSNIQPSACEANALTHRTTATARRFETWKLYKRMEKNRWRRLKTDARWKARLNFEFRWGKMRKQEKPFATHHREQLWWWIYLVIYSISSRRICWDQPLWCHS